MAKYIKLINPETKEAMTLSLLPVSAETRLKVSEVESKYSDIIQAKTMDIMKPQDGDESKLYRYVSMDEVIEITSNLRTSNFDVKDVKDIQNVNAALDPEQHNTLRMMTAFSKKIFQVVKEEHEDLILLDMARVIIDTTVLNEKNKELIESDVTEPFWQKQDLEEVAKAVDYFRRKRK